MTRPILIHVTITNTFSSSQQKKQTLRHIDAPKETLLHLWIPSHSLLISTSSLPPLFYGGSSTFSIDVGSLQYARNIQYLQRIQILCYEIVPQPPSQEWTIQVYRQSWNHQGNINSYVLILKKNKKTKTLIICICQTPACA